MYHFTRQLGFPLRLGTNSVSGLAAHQSTIKNALWKHGCVCIKEVDFDPAQMTKLTSLLWKEAIELPEFLMFNNQDKAYRTVARVGNILADGSLKDSKKQATYWHQDGNFWGQGKKHIFNCLHSKEQPTSGGDTHVMDLVQGAQFLKTKKPQVYRRLKELIGELNLQNINDFKLYNAKNTMDIDTVTYHRIINPFINQNQEFLFLSLHQLLDAKTKLPVDDLTIAQVHEILEKEMGFYAHKWEKGDLLIWDNLQVMHRASGEFQGRRLLFRTQGRQLPSLL